MGPRQQLSPPTPSGAALVALRQSTASYHARIESLLGLGGPFGRSHYGIVLQGFGAFLDTWEPRIARALPADVQAWFALGRRCALIHRDLRRLGLQRLAPEVDVCPRIDNPPQALGSLYVMEGAALGGQLIAAGLRRRLGIEADTGGAYFNGCGKGTAVRWREYRELAGAALDGDRAARALACDAAVQTFEALIATFQDLLHVRAAA